MFILGTSSVLAFIGNNPIDLIGPVPQTLRLGLRSFPIAGAIARRHSVDDSAHDIFNKRSCHRQFAFTNGRRLGPPAPELVFASASAIQNTDQLNHLRRRGHAGDRHLQPDRRRNSGSISTRGQRRERFLRNRLFTYVRDPDRRRAPRFVRALRSGCASRPSAAVPSHCLAIFFTIYPIIDVPSPLIFAAKIIAVTGIANASASQFTSLARNVSAR